MASTLQAIVSDQFRIFGLKSDGSLWVASAIEPLVWSSLPVYNGSGVVASLALARTTPNDNTLSLYTLCSDGTLWRLTSGGTWYKENTP